MNQKENNIFKFYDENNKTFIFDVYFRDIYGNAKDFQAYGNTEVETSLQLKESLSLIRDKINDCISKL